MRFLLVLLLISAVTCVFFHQDVFTDGSLSDTGHKTLKALEADYKNSESEQKRLQGRVDTYEEERNRYINLANDLIGADNSSVSSMHSIAVSALSSSYKDKIASRLGLTAQAVLNLFGSSSLESTIESFISTAKTNDGSAWSAYNNTNRTEGYDSANSAIEAWYENGRAADHHNAHVSPGEYLIGTPPPDEPSDIKWPSFSCPDGSCGLSWLLPSSARTAHYAKCGTKDDPYDKYLKGCYKVFYTCNTTETARHKPKDCGLEKWVKTSSGYSKTSCADDYRECTRFHRDHSTFVRGVNGRSMCGPASSSSSPIVSPTQPLTPTDNTPNCPDCTSHCSSPCSCSTSGTCNGTVVDNTPNCSDCTSHCSSPCSCTNSGTCNGTVVDNTPDCSWCTDGCSSCDSDDDDDDNGVCQRCGGANYYPCAYCGGTFDICDVYTSCSSSPDGWCSSVAYD